MSSRITLVIIALLMLSGCVSALNQKEAQIHFEAAQAYDAQGDFESARDHYWKALVNARLAKADAATLSMLTYNFGRTTGYTCRLDEAERYLEEALTMELDVTGPNSGVTTKRIFELARLNYDRGRFPKAVEYYSDGLPKIRNLGVERSDPIGLAAALEEYAEALNKIGETSRAASASSEAAGLRARYPDRAPAFTPVRYSCAS